MRWLMALQEQFPDLEAQYKQAHHAEAARQATPGMQQPASLLTTLTSRQRSALFVRATFPCQSLRPSGASTPRDLRSVSRS